MSLRCFLIGVHMMCNVIDLCYEKYKSYHFVNFVGIVGDIIFVMSLDD